MIQIKSMAEFAASGEMPEILFWVGCAGSFDQRAQKITKAFATIFDSHFTALIAAIALFWLGAGPIRGFAVTMAIGIITTLFTSYLVTRLIVVWWIQLARPKTVPL